MLRVLIWQVSDDKTSKDFALQILEYQHDGLEIVGEAVNDDIAKVDGGGDYEILAVGAKKIGMSKVIENARRLNLPEEKLLGDWIVTIPGFTLEKYRRLQRSRLSIFSMNCFGGLISNSLGLTFRSPFINLFTSAQDFLKFALSPRAHIETNLAFQENKFSSFFKHDYPIFQLKDITVNMLHYYSADDAIAKWNERKQRINWYNLLAVMCTEDKKILEQFDALPYGKKICFVSFKSDLDSAWYINRKLSKQTSFLEVANDFAKARVFYYDPFDMLLYGKKTPLIEM